MIDLSTGRVLQRFKGPTADKVSISTCMHMYV